MYSSFGEDVRRVRLARRLTQTQLGLAAGYSTAHVSKVEAGLVTVTMGFAEGCDRAFGTGDLFARQLRRLEEGEHPAWFAPYIEAEWEAKVIRDYSIAFIMGLLQTEDYARAVLELGRKPLPEEEVEVQVRSRLRRREVWCRTPAPRAWVILHEACLRVKVGSSRVMADQIAFILAELKRHPTLTVQVLPNESAGAAINTPFTMLEVPDASPVVYVEGPQGGRPYDAKRVVFDALEIFDHLRACSLSPHESVAYLTSIKDDHERQARMDSVQLQRWRGRTVRRVGAGSRVHRNRPRPGQ